MRTMASHHSSGRWEELRKEASQVENELYIKLVSFSKLGASYSHHESLTAGRSDGSGSSQASAESSGRMFETMSLEIEQLMNKLTEVNDTMQEHVNQMTETAPTPTMLHMLQRHRDILRNYSQEFSKTKTNIKAHQDREDLLGSVRRDISEYKASAGGLNRRTDMYLKENEHLRNSERLTDEAISVAMATKENLTSQRGVFGNIGNRLSGMTSRFPLVNSLVQRIQVKKKKDSLILGGVIAVCIIILLLYAF
ncbi:Golgi SNAP receptor complex member 1-like [Corticium candelabrum]|uniref:Golgi SNAP receptor complex member 1-like n=1 Tax=Corticium candelabrum TaxID=121492 RepID=UPI002E263AA1|nr:Golgi SNAP receptor complex member 1-like [Corticium candelabrum]